MRAAFPSFPPAAPIWALLVAALTTLLSVAGDAGCMGHLHTVSLLSSSATTLSQLATNARLLAAPTFVVLAHFCCALESGAPGAAVEHAYAALLPLTVRSLE